MSRVLRRSFERVRGTYRLELLSVSGRSVLGAFPIRRPSRQEFKRDKLRVDPDGVTIERAESGSELRNGRNEARTRFQDLVAANLNTRRAIRTMVLPALADIQSEMRALHARLDRIEAALAVDHEA